MGVLVRRDQDRDTQEGKTTQQHLGKMAPGSQEEASEETKLATA
jgi:hypothetical protein